MLQFMNDLLLIQIKGLTFFGFGRQIDSTIGLKVHFVCIIHFALCSNPKHNTRMYVVLDF